MVENLTLYLFSIFLNFRIFIAKLGKKIYNFDHSLSQESIHVRWYLGVISEFVEKRNSFDKKFFLEATHVLDGIKKLYGQAEKWR